MATRTSVTRRVIFAKVKRQHQALSLPRGTQQVGSGDGLRNVTADVYTELAARPRARPWWRNPWVLLGGAAVLGLAAMLVLGNRARQAAADELADYGGPRMRAKGLPSRPGNAGARDGVTVDYAQRPSPTDESFRATPYVRRGATVLPADVSGKCVVSGMPQDELGDCLARHGGK